MATKELTLANFESTVNDNDIVIVDFWAPWCGPCKAFGPIYDRVAEKYPDVVFGKVNTEAEQQLAGSMQIRSIPTLMIFRDNVLLFSQPGMLPEAALDDLVEQTKKLDMDQVRADIEAQKAQKAAASA